MSMTSHMPHMMTHICLKLLVRDEGEGGSKGESEGEVQGEGEDWEFTYGCAFSSAPGSPPDPCHYMYLKRAAATVNSQVAGRPASKRMAEKA